MSDTEAEPVVAEGHQKKDKKATPAKATPAKATPKPERASIRERKQVEVFKPAEVHSTEPLTITEGKGEKLADIPNVAFRLGKMKGADELVEDIHVVLYGRKGKALSRKKDIGQFSGFVFEDETKDEDIKKVQEKLGRWKVEHLNKFMELLDIPKSGLDKEGKVDAIVKFLEEPATLSEKDLAAANASKKEAAKKKKERLEAAKEKRKDKKESKKAKEKKSTPKRKAVESAGKAAKKSKKKVAEEEEDDEAEEMEEGSDGDSDDELPLAAFVPPSKKAIKAAVEDILSNVDIGDFNLKKLMAAMKKRFKTNLKPQKDLIKRTAILFSASQPVEQDDEDGEEEEEGEEGGEGEEGDQEGEGAAGDEEDGDEEAEAAAEGEGVDGEEKEDKEGEDEDDA